MGHGHGRIHLSLFCITVFDTDDLFLLFFLSFFFFFFPCGFYFASPMDVFDGISSYIIHTYILTYDTHLRTVHNSEKREYLGNRIPLPPPSVIGDRRGEEGCYTIRRQSIFLAVLA